MIRTAGNLGLRVLVDLVLNHTSNQHPWFQQARRDRSSRYRGYYRWSDEKQSEPSEVAFPGEQDSTWTYDDAAGQWYMHRYYDFMPELNITEPDVRDEMNKVLGFWLELGVSGFRVDSLQFMIETVGTQAREQPVSYLRSLVEFTERRRGTLALALTMALPGTPVLMYGDEIGMGENLSLPGASPSAARCSGRHGRGAGSPPPPGCTGRPARTARTATAGSTWPASATSRARCTRGWPMRAACAANARNWAGETGGPWTPATRGCWPSTTGGVTVTW